MAPGMMGWDPGRPTGGCGVGTVLSWRRHPLPSSCSTPQSLTCPGILRVGRVPPGNRDDMKGWKRGWESAIFILYFP